MVKKALEKIRKEAVSIITIILLASYLFTSYRTYVIQQQLRQSYLELYRSTLELRQELLELHQTALNCLEERNQILGSLEDTLESLHNQ